jgi:sulfate adenylyltransferase subunit 1
MKIKNDLLKLVDKLNVTDAHFIPISALNGDNVVDSSDKMKWYQGKTFLDLIETIKIKKDKNSKIARFPVQTIIRPDSAEYHDYRGYAGRVAGGTFLTGDEIIVLPSMLKSKISGIDDAGKRLSEASTGDSVCLTLQDPIDISRGDMIVKAGELPHSARDINLMICWFNERQLKTGVKYLVRTNTNETTCIIKSVNYKININNLEKNSTDKDIRMNDISNISIRTSKPLFFDTYVRNNTTGSLIFIEEGTNETVGAGMIMLEDKVSISV